MRIRGAGASVDDPFARPGASTLQKVDIRFLHAVAGVFVSNAPEIFVLSRISRLDAATASTSRRGPRRRLRQNHDAGPASHRWGDSDDHP